MTPNIFGRMRENRHSRADAAADPVVEQTEERPAADRSTGQATGRPAGLTLGQAAESATRASREERLTERFASQWHERRQAARREVAFPTIQAGPSNFTRAQVPWAFDLAAAWSWRLIIIAAAIFGSLWLLGFFAVVVIPLLIALFACALVSPVVRALESIGLGRRLASLLVVVVGLIAIGLLLTFVGNQVANGMDSLSRQVVDGVGQVRDWLRTGPLGLSDKDLQGTLQNLQDQISGNNSSLLSRLSEVGTTVTHIVAGFFIILFATYFFLSDGALIWTWMVRLFPRAARDRVDSSGHVAWRSLTQFVRATVLVAATDALGIALGALVLGVPLVLPIGVLVFLGAFVPMIGATVSGAVAVLVALVAVGPVKALIMLAVIIFVQQLEAHVLQPFLMGRFVSVHPLGVILAIACGVLVAGIAGALVAVPFAAVLNAVGQHLADQTEIGESAAEAAADDPLPPDPPAGEPEPA